MIEATATIGFGGVDWIATTEAEVDGNEYLGPDVVEIKPAPIGQNVGWTGDCIVVDFGDLPDAAQNAIQFALSRELSDYLINCADTERDYE
jgi:hypothetical protein